MAFTKKSTRRIVVDGISYRWHLHNNHLWKPGRNIAVELASGRCGVLLIDPYSWHTQIRPKAVREAILFAIKSGWNPAENSEPFKVTFTEAGPARVDGR